MKFDLVKAALSRPITVVMITISMMIIGALAWFRTPLTFLPDIDEPFIGLFVPFPGASPEQVEEQIAIPVEGELRTIPGLRRLRTVSDEQGVFASMLFSLETNITTVTAEVRDRMERLKLVLPDEADQMIMQRFSSRSIPVMAIGFFRKGNEEDFVHQLRTRVVPRLKRLEGVANIEIITPIKEREVLIEFDQNLLRSMNLALAPLVATLQQSSLNLTVGSLDEGAQTAFVRVIGEYRRIEDIQNIVVAPNGLRLKDIARVRFSARDEVAHVTLDGEGGAVMLITKESEANTVATCERIAEELPRVMRMPGFEEVRLRKFFDQSELILSALNNLFLQGIYGGAMAIAVLFLFLHRIRPTIIVALSIPSSLLVAFVFMFFYGMELNLITMVSMIIAVGMLVDNGIVVVENIMRHRLMGDGPVEAARKGASEVGLAIFASTLTTWVVFIPMFYMKAGRMSVFMEQLGLPLIVALGGSLLIALTLIPLTMSRMRDTSLNFYQRTAARLGFGHLFMAQEGGGVSWLSRLNPVQWIVDLYGAALDFSLRWRLAAMLLLAGMLAISYYIPFQRVGMRDIPKLDTREVKIDIETEQNYGMEETRKLFQTIEEQIGLQREELGIKNIFTFYERGGGVIELYLYTTDDGPEWAAPKYDTEAVMRIVSERLPRMVPGAELKFTVTDTSASGSEAAVSVTMRGDDTRELERYASQFRQVMAAIPDISDVTTDVERSKREVQIKIDDALASRRGVSPLVIATTVDAALRGARLPFMKQGGREVPVWAQFREEDRKSRANLENVAVASLTGELIPLSELVTYSKDYSPAAIHRVDGKNTIQINANTTSANLSKIMADVQRAADEFELPPGYSIRFGQQLVELGENVFQFGTTMLMAVVLIYIVMASLFESLLLPLCVLTTVPLSLAGAYWMLYMTNTQLDSVTMIGCILMAGVIVNNGIVIVDHINNMRRISGSREAAIVLAGKNRFRPVMMTAITTILGVVPLAMAKTGGAATFAGLGKALAGGMTMGTMLTLFVVPWFYCMFDDIQQWLLNFLGSLRGRPVAPEARGEASAPVK